MYVAWLGQSCFALAFGGAAQNPLAQNVVRAAASASSYASHDAEAGVGGELGNGISARLSVLYQRRDDWVDNLDAPGENNLEGFEDLAARLQIQADLSDAFTVRVVGQIRDFDGTARLFRANAFAKGSNKLIGLGGPTTEFKRCLLYTSPSPRDMRRSRMPSSA